MEPYSLVTIEIAVDAMWTPVPKAKGHLAATSS
jgi:hypothetical protein